MSDSAFVTSRELGRQIGSVLDRLRDSGQPLVVTRHGLPIAVLHPVTAEAARAAVVLMSDQARRAFAEADLELKEGSHRDVFEVLAERGIVEDDSEERSASLGGDDEYHTVGSILADSHTDESGRLDTDRRSRSHHLLRMLDDIISSMRHESWKTEQLFEALLPSLEGARIVIASPDLSRDDEAALGEAVFAMHALFRRLGEKKSTAVLDQGDLKEANEAYTNALSIDPHANLVYAQRAQTRMLLDPPDVVGAAEDLGRLVIWSEDARTTPSRRSSSLIDRQPSESPKPTLSKMEIKTLELVAEGKTSREIGEQFGISESTVKKLIEIILHKLGLHSRNEAVQYAMREDLIRN